jgi:hypothetical protein
MSLAVIFLFTVKLYREDGSSGNVFTVRFCQRFRVVETRMNSVLERFCHMYPLLVIYIYAQEMSHRRKFGLVSRFL